MNEEHSSFLVDASSTIIADGFITLEEVKRLCEDGGEDNGFVDFVNSNLTKEETVDRKLTGDRFRDLATQYFGADAVFGRQDSAELAFSDGSSSTESTKDLSIFEPNPSNKRQKVRRKDDDMSSSSSESLNIRDLRKDTKPVTSLDIEKTECYLREIKRLSDEVQSITARNREYMNKISGMGSLERETRRIESDCVKVHEEMITLKEQLVSILKEKAELEQKMTKIHINNYHKLNAKDVLYLMVQMTEMIDELQKTQVDATEEKTTQINEFISNCKTTVKQGVNPTGTTKQNPPIGGMMNVMGQQQNIGGSDPNGDKLSNTNTGNDGDELSKRYDNRLLGAGGVGGNVSVGGLSTMRSMTFDQVSSEAETVNRTLIFLNSIKPGKASQTLGDGSILSGTYQVMCESTIRSQIFSLRKCRVFFYSNGTIRIYSEQDKRPIMCVCVNNFCAMMLQPNNARIRELNSPAIRSGLQLKSSETDKSITLFSSQEQDLIPWFELVYSIQEGGIQNRAVDMDTI